MSAFTMGAGASDSTAQASISPQERASVVQTYKIPPGPMAAALNSFAAANGLHLVYDADVTQRLKASGLYGRFSTQEGLDHLLAGTGLSYRIGPTGRTVSIVLAQNDTGTGSDASHRQALPTIEVGAAKPAVASETGAGGPGDRDGTSITGYGGAGAAQDPYNKSYVLEKASTGTKTNTPVMDTPLNVQSVSQQVLRDQQAITLGDALQNVSGVSATDGAFALTGLGSSGLLVRGFIQQTYYRDGFRLDSTYLGTGFGSNGVQLANIASVDVLKGPGAVLYGLVEPGGIVNLVTKQPLRDTYYAVEKQIGYLAI